MKVIPFALLFTSVLGTLEPKCCGEAEESTSFLSIISYLSDLTRSSSFGPLRIKYKFVDFDLGNATENTYFQSVVAPASTAWFSKSLKVKNLLQPLVLKGIADCNEVSVPLEDQIFGVTDTDLLIYVSTETSPNITYVGNAGACTYQIDDIGSPLVGRIFFSTVNYAKLSNFESKIQVLNHETAHILGFSSSGMSRWRKPDGVTPYLYSELTTTATIRGKSRTFLITPTVLSTARLAFDCPTLIGAELSSDLSHWNMRAIFNDFMITHIVPSPIYSTLTMAALQDSGWYQVDYSFSQTPVWGRGAGCDLFTTNCITNGVANFKNFCVDANKGCDPLRMHKSVCNIQTFASALPTPFQYFSTSTVGGSDPDFEYCGFKKAYSNGSCQNTGKTSTVIYSYYGEALGPSSRCFEGTLLANGYVQKNTTHSACYPLSCSGGVATFTVISGSSVVNVVCPVNGGQVTVAGFTGFIQCPAYSDICSDYPCMNGCYGIGKCVNGVCQCPPGYTVPDCSA